jgi:exonuclease III
MTTTQRPGDRRPDPSTLTIMALNAEFLWDGVAPEEGHERVAFPWRGNPVEAARHMREIADVITASDPDVVVLCEVENRDALEHFNERFLDGLGYRAYLHEGVDVDTGHDVGLLTRVDAIETGYYSGFGNRDGVRKGLAKNIYARMRVGDLKLGLVGVHLVARPDDPTRRAAREAQAVALRALVLSLRKSGYLPVVCGDFNDYDGDPNCADVADSFPISRVLRIARELDPGDARDDLVNAASHVPKVSRYTVHCDLNRNGREDRGDRFTSIDHILLANELEERIERVDILHDHDPTTVTNHFPVVVRLRVTR